MTRRVAVWRAERGARLADNACLAAADRLGLAALPLISLGPLLLAADDTPDVHTHAQWQAVGGLRTAHREHGAGVVIARGEVVEKLAKQHARVPFTRPVPAAFYTGTTGIDPVDRYAHVGIRDTAAAVSKLVLPGHRNPAPDAPSARSTGAAETGDGRGSSETNENTEPPGGGGGETNNPLDFQGVECNRGALRTPESGEGGKRFHVPPQVL